MSAYSSLSNKLRKTHPGAWKFCREFRNLCFTPFEGIAHRKYTPNNKVSIVIHTDCNINCVNCYVIDKAGGEMSVAQIRAFVDEALKLGRRWDEIELRGGETTLHPHFFDILEIIKEYKDAVPECRIAVLTNGVGPKVKEVISKMPAWIDLCGVQKTDKENIYPQFWVVTKAPIDLWQYKFFTDFSKGCSRISECNGLCLSKYGIYPHPPCAEVDKVFGFNIGIKKLSQVNEKAQRSQMNMLCRYCGFFIEQRELFPKAKWTNTWIKAHSEYTKQKPKLTVY